MRPPRAFLVNAAGYERAKMRSTAYTASHIPGRIRLKIPHAKHNARVLEAIAESTRTLSGVQSVEHNPTTGSLLIHYDPQLNGNFEKQLAEHGASTRHFSLQPSQPQASGRRPSRRQSEAAKTISHFFTSVDDEVRYVTDNYLDLKVLLPLAAIGVGITTFAREGSRVTPIWLTLGIFAFSSFLSLHSVVGSPAEEAVAEEAMLLDGLVQ